MNCKVCGAESGKYPLCWDCNTKKERGEIIKCKSCGNWHYFNAPCHIVQLRTNEGAYLYEAEKTLITRTEQAFYEAIKMSLPAGYCVFPQINLECFINRTDGARYRNELFRIVDFLVTDPTYRPTFVIEVNDRTHLNPDRRERDEKVQKICEEAGIPVLTLWASYGVNQEYIKERIDEILASLPVARVHHFSQSANQQRIDPTPRIPVQPDHQKPFDTTPKEPVQPAGDQGGCYIATCVYGSYDCPQVWTLRRYRDNTLASTWYGRAFIQAYYCISPMLVKWFGHTDWFKKLWKRKLDKMVTNLLSNGVENTPYQDKTW